MTVALLEKRVGEIAGEVERALTCELAIEEDLASLAGARWISTGAGSSEGPARLFATLLRERGVVADYAPISSFVASAPRADACVIVSQRLSPNAKFPIARAHAFKKIFLVTSVSPDALAPNVRVIQHGPRDEDGLLLRVVGPAAANATIMRVVSKLASNGHASRPENIATVLASARDRARSALAESHASATALFDVACVLATGADVALAEGLKHKLLEGLGRAVQTIDLCALVHGPLQSFYDRAATLVVLSRDNCSFGERMAVRELSSRLATVLHPERHCVIHLSSSLPGPYALLDFDLQLDDLLLEALRARPRDLADWPGKGRDAALYDWRPPI